MQTELDAVNYLLDVLGSPPVGELDTLHPDVATCQSKLRDSSIFVQSTGYWFNQDYNWVLTPDVNGELFVPNTVLKVLAIHNKFAIQRGTKLYDPTTHEYIFTEPVTIDIIEHLPWELLPTSVQNAVKYHAAMQVCTIDLEDSNKANDQEKLYTAAHIQVKAEDLELKHRNMLRTPAAMRYQTAARPYSRRRTGGNPMLPGGGR